MNSGVRSCPAFEDVLVRQCALTLAGMKPGSLFCFKNCSLETSRQKVSLWDRRLKPFGMSVRILLERPEADAVIVYLYRPEEMAEHLSQEDCRCFLAAEGYTAGDLEELLDQLAYRLRTQPEFPHEIGVFLGYPLQDVIGFIENQGRNFTCCGCWKSYGDPAQAEAYFTCCRQCVQEYVDRFARGVPIEQLAVSA